MNKAMNIQFGEKLEASQSAPRTLRATHWQAQAPAKLLSTQQDMAATCLPLSRFFNIFVPTRFPVFLFCLWNYYFSVRSAKKYLRSFFVFVQRNKHFRKNLPLMHISWTCTQWVEMSVRLLQSVMGERRGQVGGIRSHLRTQGTSPWIR